MNDNERLDHLESYYSKKGLVYKQVKLCILPSGKPMEYLKMVKTKPNGTYLVENKKLTSINNIVNNSIIKEKSVNISLNRLKKTK